MWLHLFTVLKNSLQYNNSLFCFGRYTTSPHLFEGDAEDAFIRVRNKVWVLHITSCFSSIVNTTDMYCQVKVPLYGCDCYAYALLASGFVDIVVESGLKV